MRAIIRPFVAAFGIALAAPLAGVALSQASLAQADQPGPAEAIKQVALTDAQIQAVLAAKKDVDAILQKVPEGANADQPDPKVMGQLDAVAKKHKFANYAEYDDIVSNIGLVMSGIDPETKKYVGAEAVTKKQIAQIQGDKTMSAKDKKDALDQLNAMLKSVTPVQFPANIQLVLKYYDKLGELMQQG